jgi:hypothetical protein
MTSTSHQNSPVAHEVHKLERIADAGKSPWTPAIVLGEIGVVCAVAVLALLAITLLAVRLAT